MYIVFYKICKKSDYTRGFPFKYFLSVYKDFGNCILSYEEKNI